MKDINKVILVGRLGADPVRRETKNGNPVVSFSLATSRRLSAESAAGQGASGAMNATEGEDGVARPLEVTQWHRIVAWGKQGETCSRFLRKGDSVYIEGSLRSHKYEGKEGITRLAFEVVAEEVSFLGSPRRRTENEESSAVEAVAAG